jgi:tetratricopeptide (TPR) repeat protein
MTEEQSIQLRARQAVEREDYSEAYDLYNQWLKDHPNDTQVMLDYGRTLYYEQGDLEKAARLFQRVVELEPQSVTALLWLASTYEVGYGLGYTAAVDVYRRVIELAPNNTDAYVGLGLQYRAPSAPLTIDEAMDAFREAIRLNPNRTDAHIDLAMLLLDKGDIATAREELSVAVQQLNKMGNHKLAKGMQEYIDKIDRHEPITTRTSPNFSLYYDWLKNEQ